MRVASDLCMELFLFFFQYDWNMHVMYTTQIAKFSQHAIRTYSSQASLNSTEKVFEGHSPMVSGHKSLNLFPYAHDLFSASASVDLS